MEKTNLITKMEKAMNFCKAYKEDFDKDLEWMADEKIGYQDYLWVVKEAGTELIPLSLAVAKGCFENDKAHLLTEREIRAYLVKVNSRENGTFDGAITGMKNLKKFLANSEKTPSAVSMKFNLTNGKSEEVTAKWHPDYREIMEDMIEAAPEDIDSAVVTEVIY